MLIGGDGKNAAQTGLFQAILQVLTTWQEVNAEPEPPKTDPYRETGGITVVFSQRRRPTRRRCLEAWPMVSAPGLPRAGNAQEVL